MLAKDDPTFIARVRGVAQVAVAMATDHERRAWLSDGPSQQSPGARLEVSIRQGERKEQGRRQRAEHLESFVVRRLEQARDAAPLSLMYRRVLSGWGLHVHYLEWLKGWPTRGLWVAVDPKIGLARFAWALGRRPIAAVNVASDRVSPAGVEGVIFALLDQAVWGVGDLPSLLHLLGGEDVLQPSHNA